MWFNNCVGKSNYGSFMVSIISTFGFAVVVIVHTVVSSTQVDFKQGSQLARIIAAWLGALLMAVFGFLLFNLILLHLYLIANDMTTYQFLQRRKKQEEDEKKGKEAKEREIITMSQSLSNNKVMPEATMQFEKVEVKDSRKESVSKMMEEEEIKTENEKSHGKLEDIH